MPQTVFVYEFITGGGWFSLSSEPPSGSLLYEGRAMLNAIIEDFARIPNTVVQTLCDTRLRDDPEMQQGLAVAQTLNVSSPAEHDALITRLSRQSDTVFVVAPELDGQLLRITDLVRAAGGNLLGPDQETIRWTSNKNLAAKRLAAAGIPTPCTFDRVNQRKFPLVAKRVDGAGSECVRRFDTPDQLEAFMALPENDLIDFRFESYCDGTAVSVALLLGPDSFVTLPACTQNLSDDGRFTYRGGSVLPNSQIADRACELAQRVAPLLRGTGYVGIDMVLSDREQEGWVIELNPRLTTSYVGLRAAVNDNLAEAMLQMANGKTLTKERRLVSVNREATFSADGMVEEGQYP